MKYSDDYQDDADPTQFEPTPWGSRQRVLPRRAFKAVASVIAPLPPPPVLQAEPSWFVAQNPMLRIESSSFITPIVREADVQTWRVPKLPPPSNAARFDIRRFDVRLWLPIASLVAVLVLAFFGTRSTTHLSAALTSEPHPIMMATIEAPAPVAVAPVVAEPAPVAKQIAVVEHAPVAKRVALAAPAVKRASKRPHLDMNVATPLGDLAKRRR